MADTPQEAGTLQTAATYERPAVAVAMTFTRLGFIAASLLALFAALTVVSRWVAAGFVAAAGFAAGRVAAGHVAIHGIVGSLIVGSLVAGSLVALARILAATTRRTNENRPIAFTIGLPGKLVAGTGFEPVTFGL